MIDFAVYQNITPRGARRTGLPRQIRLNRCVTLELPNLCKLAIVSIAGGLSFFLGDEMMARVMCSGLLLLMICFACSAAETEPLSEVQNRFIDVTQDWGELGI